MKPLNIDPTIAQLRQFGWMLLIGFPCIAGIAYWKGHFTASLVLASLGVLAGSLTLIKPTASRGLYRGWMRLGIAIGTVVSPIVMSVIYFTVVTPMGLLLRCTGRDALQLKKRAPGESYWTAHKTDMPPEYYKRLF